jgi:hypothetical protein
LQRSVEINQIEEVTFKSSCKMQRWADDQVRVIYLFAVAYNVDNFLGVRTVDGKVMETGITQVIFKDLIHHF